MYKFSVNFPSSVSIIYNLSLPVKNFRFRAPAFRENLAEIGKKFWERLKMSRFFGPRRFQGLKLLSEEFQVSVQSLNKLIFVTTKEF